ncbi:hypothetical protein SmJEL517_g00554 [Synchytrium microbalum]|uniref:serine C-palmitoyltransferase n=1 Tax=Synchytrium microbalum TaxID=1806994 RepID=A0A507C9D9_9FUNG|nr:uncharacterized protein SmJEL517_g00554 [Synchytrium microbalum]TPX37687.1 hypothetical protein SmJEL517_g00554 [Synchytrium microbalum]
MGKGASDLMFATLSLTTESPSKLQYAALENGKHSIEAYPCHHPTSRKLPKQQKEVHPPNWVLLLTYCNFVVLFLVFSVKTVIKEVVDLIKNMILGYASPTPPGFAPVIANDLEAFLHRHFYPHMQECFHRPITDAPGAYLTLLERVQENGEMKLTGETQKVLNLSSYNYLGFAESSGRVVDAVEDAVATYGITVCSPRMELGTLDLHSQVEALVARFVGQEAAVVVSMGFATNSTTLPAIVEKGCLVVSDSLNHASLVYGCRLSGASIRPFKHNNMRSLEKVLRDGIANGQDGRGSKSYKPWKKILVVVEGLYSMEGTICPLPQILELKRKYNFFLYVDEAHSIGAIGPKGRGVCDYYGINPREVDILMGTFTKAFSSAGGYISGSKALINRIRLYNHSSLYGEAMSIPVLQQIYSSMTIIMGEDGTNEGQRRIQNLARVTRRFRDGLKRMGFIVLGHDDSPVVPIIVCQPCKFVPFSQELLAKGIAVVMACFPATAITEPRCRLCLSAAHTMEDIEKALVSISEAGDKLDLKFLA